MTKSEGNPNDKIQTAEPRTTTECAAGSVPWHWTFFGHWSLVFCHWSLVLGPSPSGARCNAKGIEPSFGAHDAPNGERHAHAAVPGRKISAIGARAHCFPVDAVGTDGELKAIS